MRKFCLALFLLAAQLTFVPAVAAKTVPLSDVVVSLTVEMPLLGKSGGCSGTAVAANVILTATHCFPSKMLVVLKANGAPLDVVNFIDDGNDHTLVVLKENVFDTWAFIRVRDMEQGENVQLIGNPGAWKNLYRRGYVSGVDNEMAKKSWLLDLNGWHGDSGSGIFDADGYIVGVLSYGKTQTSDAGQQIKMIGAISFAFTPLQYRVAGLR